MRKQEATLQIQVLASDPRDQGARKFKRPWPSVDSLPHARLLLLCSMKGPQCSGHAKEELSREIGFSFVQKIVGLL